jgi:hypothetical protein
MNPTELLVNVNPVHQPTFLRPAALPSFATAVIRRRIGGAGGEVERAGTAPPR